MSQSFLAPEARRSPREPLVCCPGGRTWKRWLCCQRMNSNSRVNQPQRRGGQASQGEMAIFRHRPFICAANGRCRPQSRWVFHTHQDSQDTSSGGFPTQVILICGRLTLKSTAALQKVIQKLNAILIKILIAFFTRLGKIHQNSFVGIKDPK